jgi:cobalt-precorrin 5A hydrolase
VALPSPLYVIALTRRGVRTAEALSRELGAKLLLPKRLGGEVAAEGAELFELPVAEVIAGLWTGGAAGFLLVMASGIAVRSIAPLLSDKTQDPAVVVFDPEGRFAVSLLSGHLGGANELAEAAAGVLGGVAVITTATDSAGRPAAEVWARDNNFELENPRAVVTVNGAWADNEPVKLWVDPLLGTRSEVELLSPHLALVTSELDRIKEGEAWIALTPRLLELGDALVVRPKVLALGAGCRREADVELVCAGVLGAVADAGFSAKSVSILVSVDLKAEEAALIELSTRLGVEFKTYSGDELKDIEVPNPSEHVAKTVGSGSVCEAAALMAAGLAETGGKLIMEKKSESVWTAALALMSPGVVR